MRAFIAIQLPSKIKEEIEKIIKGLSKINLDCKWVESKNLHITLKFLGEVEEEEKIDSIKNIMLELAKNYSSFVVTLNSFGFFPNQNYPRVFFISTDKQEILKKIVNDLEDKLINIGFPKEGRFSSHITLARLKSAKNINLLKNELKNFTLNQTFIIQDITFIKSTLMPSGPIYETIFIATFKS
ncbi:MAG: RNA 2',3'-cyclic phosphodiesterase [Candidatus Omnitrophica bacterium]|nr:RNA 2',3'-cyclic phosphodiesterase [Candidatus Omnitrophota bacterium]